MPILVAASAHHWQRVYDESVVVHEVQEIFGHVCRFGPIPSLYLSLLTCLFQSRILLAAEGKGFIG
jgi:hypothetical protein